MKGRITGQPDETYKECGVFFVNRGTSKQHVVMQKLMQCGCDATRACMYHDHEDMGEIKEALYESIHSTIKKHDFSHNSVV